MSDSPATPGVVVTFHPDADFEARLSAIARETNPVIVVDNTGDPATASRLGAACATHGAHLIANARNVGLAAALNQAFVELQVRGFTAAVAFDQDSTPAAGFIKALRATAAADRNRAIVGANWHDEARPGFGSRHLRRHRVIPFLFERPAATQDLDQVTCVITSGTLFDLDTWSALGGFDVSLFLDLVDTDYCLRARRAGHAIAVSATARLAHRRGSKQPVPALGRTWWPAFMSPLRLRYLFRNRIHLASRHGGAVPHWVAFEIVYTVKILAEILCLETQRRAKLMACAQGLWDGLMGVEGPILRV